MIRFALMLSWLSLAGCAAQSARSTQLLCESPCHEVDPLPVVRAQPDIERYADKMVILEGRYQAIPLPTKKHSLDESQRPKQCAQIVLDDGAVVYLEAYNAQAFKRPATELEGYDGKRVRIQGWLYLVMPSKGQSLVAPCISFALILDNQKPNQEVSVVGMAQNAKAGALIDNDNGEAIYVSGLEEWTPEFLGKRVIVVGAIERKRIFPEVQVDKDGAISQGMEGIPLVITPKSFQLAP